MNYYDTNAPAELKKRAEKISGICYTLVQGWVKDNWYRTLPETAENLLNTIHATDDDFANEWEDAQREFGDEEESPFMVYIKKKCLEAIAIANHGDD